MANEFRTNGSAAYDRYSVHNNTARPLERPDRLPEIPEPVKRPVRKVKTKLAVAPFAILGGAVAAVLLLLVVFSYVRLYETQSVVTRMERTQAELLAQNARLKQQYESGIDLAAVEARAAELGLRKPTASQIIYVEVPKADVAEVYTAPEERNFFERIFDALSGTFSDAVEYFS